MNSHATPPALRGDHHCAVSTLFHGHDLAAQPFLTKRGRTIRHIVKRIFVILDGYLFYFQHAAATEPCGVVPLANAEFFVHAYASTEELSNFCFELRTPARPWGSLILHFHQSPAAKLGDVERVLTAAGARSRRQRFADPHGGGGTADSSDRTASTPVPKATTRTSRLITLSGLSAKLFWPRRASSTAATAHQRARHERSSASSDKRSDEERHSFLEHSDQWSLASNSHGDADTTSSICRATSGGRSGLLRVQHGSGVGIGVLDDDGSRSRSNTSVGTADREAVVDSETLQLLDSSTSADDAPSGDDAAAAAAARVGAGAGRASRGSASTHLRALIPFRRRSTTALEGGASFAISLSDGGGVVAEHEVSVELCHELCAKGFVENANRRLLHFIAPFWPWDRQRRGRATGGAAIPRSTGGAKFTVTIGGASGSRIRFATSFESSGCLVPYDTAPIRLVRERSEAASLSEQLAGAGLVVSGRQRTRAMSYPTVLALQQQQQQEQRVTPQLLAICASAAGENKGTPGSATPSAYHMVAARPRSPQKIAHGSVFLSAHRPPLAADALSARVSTRVAQLELSPTAASPPRSLRPAPVHAGPLPPLSPRPPKCFPPLASPSRYASLESGVAPRSRAPLELALTSDGVCFALAVSPTKPPKLSALAAAGESHVRGATLTVASTANHRLAAASAGGKSAAPPPPPSPPAAQTRDLKLVQAVSLAESYSGGYLLKQYEPLKMIGCGGFGHVMVAKHKRSGQLVAIKTLSKKAIATQHQVQHSLAEKAVSPDARNLIAGLLTVDPAERLGARKKGHGAVKEHAFFAKHVDWARLLSRSVRAPLQPRADAFANFDKQFTSMPVAAVDAMVRFPAKIPIDYQLFENYNWEPKQSQPQPPQ
ncbi:hypothetical protein PybrP1_010339 [[Pythium] brassicae (nom. inval.)]|nr:hypothetical protein PybrP1_010339 [[Pythium] brassicae (nom. inval.)]